MPDLTEDWGMVDAPLDPRIYVRVLLHVRGLVHDRTIPPGEPIPTITSLCRRFSCTRQTVSKALRLLEGDGILYRYPGLGYYVSDHV